MLNVLLESPPSRPLGIYAAWRAFTFSKNLERDGELFWSLATFSCQKCRMHFFFKKKKQAEKATRPLPEPSYGVLLKLLTLSKQCVWRQKYLPSYYPTLSFLIPSKQLLLFCFSSATHSLRFICRSTATNYSICCGLPPVWKYLFELTELENAAMDQCAFKIIHQRLIKEHGTVIAHRHIPFFLICLCCLQEIVCEMRLSFHRRAFALTLPPRSSK